MPMGLFKHSMVQLGYGQAIIGGEIRGYTDRGEYNVENLKLSRDRHENCKTHPNGFFFIHLFFNNKRAC